ncbi:Guard cell s-type anion channel slac1 [Thalictrum thalictroides]|uniref:Guard cell s-type anion channel slac1 n=1 Tax=Thalictrum thalictroides TaxID=46969 RepID=A0A7J6USP9_THATH|nr:Guard cell s-type anion channel slac1 [Thalictrum thalictroides]
MDDAAIAPSASENHFVDIHQVYSQEEDRTTTRMTTDKVEKRLNRPVKLREMKRQPRSFSRQVSLETGFSVLRRESKPKDDRRLLSRSGQSLGASGSNRVGVAPEVKKGDFDLFRTKSTLSKQNSFLPLRKDTEMDSQKTEALEGLDEESIHINRSVPAGRYFAALRGAELDQVKEYEDILLPKNEQWPFLLRFPIGCFGICLGLSSQAILWRALAQSPATKFLHITPLINLFLWLVALTMLLLISITYALKCAFYFEAVRREYFHPVRVNFFFAPWIICMFLAIGVPPVVAQERLHPSIWCIFMTPVFLLELKIYGQWLSGGKRRLSKVANPSSHLAVVGNFVGAILASKVGWQEPAKFLWAVGFAHYLVVFVTLYQRLPSSEALPKELHPVYSMFIATPAAASMAWEAIYGEFDGLSRTCYFIALFLYMSLVVRISFFWGCRFSVAWWSYTFPMTTVSLATIKYAEQVPCVLTKVLALSLSFMSSTMVSVLFVSTILHAFLWHSLFPNDLAIAITKRRNNHSGKISGKDQKPFKKAYDLRRWAKQSPLSFVSSTAKTKSEGNNFDVEKEYENIPVNSFGICLGLSSQAILWHTLAQSPATQFLHSPLINLFLWLLALAVLFYISVIYAFKYALYFKRNQEDCTLYMVHLHDTCFPARAQELWPMVIRRKKVSVQGSESIITSICSWKLCWCNLCLKGRVARACNVLVTLYQRLPTSEALPKELHPVYSMLIAAPSAASITWGTTYD